LATGRSAGASGAGSPIWPEAQYFQERPIGQRKSTDCAALIRYAYREALHGATTGHGPRGAAASDSRNPIRWRSTNIRSTPLGPRCSACSRRRSARPKSGGRRLRSLPMRRRCGGALTAFSRDVARALPGDVLFFRQDGGREPFHSMIYLGESQVRRDGNRYVLYHTAGPGQSRRNSPLDARRAASLSQSEWRPSRRQPQLPGIYRWNILRKDSDPDASRHATLDH